LAALAPEARAASLSGGDLIKASGAAVYLYATDGTRALISEEFIDLVLLDINMYEIDGGYMKEIIDEYSPELRVIVSSVRPLDEQKEIVRRESFWIDTWLNYQYDFLETRYIIHDAVAQEVDKHTFYHTRESGGTMISSAYKS